MPRRPTRYYPDYGPLLPTSGPDWRWARALEIVAAQKNASLPRDGHDIIRAIRFIRRLSRGLSKCVVKRILRKDPDLMMAYQISNEGSQRLLELQCRVLARQPAGVIAIEMGMPRSIVETYCLMFFDVAGRLDATSYILHRVIGVPMGQPPTHEVLMMLCAFYHGPEMIEPWLDYLEHHHEAHDLATPEGRMREMIDLLFAVHNLDTDSTSYSSLVRQVGTLLKTRTKAFPEPSAKPAIAQSTRTQLGELLWQPVPFSQPKSEPRAGRRPRRPVPRQTGKVA